jgi:hypothetical protein
MVVESSVGILLRMLIGNLYNVNHSENNKWFHGFNVIRKGFIVQVPWTFLFSVVLQRLMIYNQNFRHYSNITLYLRKWLGAGGQADDLLCKKQKLSKEKKNRM